MISSIILCLFLAGSLMKYQQYTVYLLMSDTHTTRGNVCVCVCVRVCVCVCVCCRLSESIISQVQVDTRAT